MPRVRLDFMVEPRYTVKALDQSTWAAFAALVERNNGIFGGCWCMGFHPKESWTDVAQKRAAKEQARQRLRAADKARTAYVRRLYRCDPADASLYHLVIDSTAIPLDAVTELILTAARAHDASVPEQGETHSARW
jgi:Cytidylate kinase-like family